MSFDEQPDADIHGECAAEIAALRAENEALRKDAERYRWIGAHCKFVSADERSNMPRTIEVFCAANRTNETWTALDHAIDAALDATEKKP